MTTLTPTTSEELQELVQNHHLIHPFAGQSKPALAAVPEGTTALDMRGLSGIIEYDPNEYTFTAYAGTPVAKVAAELEKHGQYMPFDPLLTAAGATLGGTVAANTSGSGRFRYGGVRDFLIGIRFVDGHGRLVRGGGKVVKNASGFDLPKFFVGSLGRYGILTELTFKVFPQPRQYVTLKLTYATLDAALQTTFKLANTPFEMDALDLQPEANLRFNTLIRLGGLPDALPGRVERLRSFLEKHTAVQEVQVLKEAAEQTLWAEINAVQWANPNQYLVKIPLPPKRLSALNALDGLEGRHYTAAGNVAWVTTAALVGLNAHLISMGLSGLVLTGSPQQSIIGARPGLPLERRVKQALDPQGKFGSIE